MREGAETTKRCRRYYHAPTQHAPTTSERPEGRDDKTNGCIPRFYAPRGQFDRATSPGAGARRPNRLRECEGVALEERIRGSASEFVSCLLYTSPSPRDRQKSRM